MASVKQLPSVQEALWAAIWLRSSLSCYLAQKPSELLSGPEALIAAIWPRSSLSCYLSQKPSDLLSGQEALWAAIWTRSPLSCYIWTRSPLSCYIWTRSPLICYLAQKPSELLSVLKSNRFTVGAPPTLEKQPAAGCINTRLVAKLES